MKQTIIINELPPGLNGSNGLKNMHHFKYSKEKKRWVWLVKEQNPKKHSGKVKVRFTRCSTNQTDLDNVGASFKFVGDALVKCGAIKDDSPDILVELTVQWQKESKRKEQRVEILIEDYE